MYISPAMVKPMNTAIAEPLTDAAVNQPVEDETPWWVTDEGTDDNADAGADAGGADPQALSDVRDFSHIMSQLCDESPEYELASPADSADSFENAAGYGAESRYSYDEGVHGAVAPQSRLGTSSITVGNGSAYSWYLTQKNYFNFTRAETLKADYNTYIDSVNRKKRIGQTTPKIENPFSDLPAYYPGSLLQFNGVVTPSNPASFASIVDISDFVPGVIFADAVPLQNAPPVYVFDAERPYDTTFQPDNDSGDDNAYRLRYFIVGGTPVSVWGTKRHAQAYACAFPKKPFITEFLCNPYPKFLPLVPPSDLSKPAPPQLSAGKDLNNDYRLYQKYAAACKKTRDQDISFFKRFLNIKRVSRYVAFFSANYCGSSGAASYAVRYSNKVLKFTKVSKYACTYKAPTGVFIPEIPDYNPFFIDYAYKEGFATHICTLRDFPEIATFSYGYGLPRPVFENEGVMHVLTPYSDRLYQQESWQKLISHWGNTVVITEGAKKAIVAMEVLGVPIVSINGVNGWGSRTEDNLLLNLLRRYGVKNVVLAFDSDDPHRPKSVENVFAAQNTFARYLNANGITVTKAFWNPDEGKGLDDLILSKLQKQDKATVVSEMLQLLGLSSDNAVTDKPTSPESLSKQKKAHALKAEKNKRRFNAQYCLKMMSHYAPMLPLKPGEFVSDKVDLASIPLDRKISVLLAAPMGAGKTHFIQQLVERVRAEKPNVAVLSLSHRISLSIFLGNKLGLTTPYRPGHNPLNQSCCIHSCTAKGKSEITKFIGATDSYRVVVIDECDLVLSELFTSSLLKTTREIIYRSFKAALHNADLVVISQAQISARTFPYWQALLEGSELLHFAYCYASDSNPNAQVATTRLASKEQLLEALIADLRAGKSVALGVNSAHKASKFQPDAIVGLLTAAEVIKPSEVLIYSAATRASSDSRLGRYMWENSDASVDDMLRQEKPRLFIYTPAIESGVDVQHPFDANYLLAFTTSVSSNLQMIGRIRNKKECKFFVPTTALFSSNDEDLALVAKAGKLHHLIEKEYAALKNASADEQLRERADTHLKEFSGDYSALYDSFYKKNYFLRCVEGSCYAEFMDAALRNAGYTVVVAEAVTGKKETPLTDYLGVKKSEILETYIAEMATAPSDVEVDTLEMYSSSMYGATPVPQKALLYFEQKSLSERFHLPVNNPLFAHLVQHYCNRDMLLLSLSAKLTNIATRISSAAVNEKILADLYHLILRNKYDTTTPKLLFLYHLHIDFLPNGSATPFPYNKCYNVWALNRLQHPASIYLMDKYGYYLGLEPGDVSSVYSAVVADDGAITVNVNLKAPHYQNVVRALATVGINEKLEVLSTLYKNNAETFKDLMMAV